MSIIDFKAFWRPVEEGVDKGIAHAQINWQTSCQCMFCFMFREYNKPLEKSDEKESKD